MQIRFSATLRQRHFAGIKLMDAREQKRTYRALWPRGNFLKQQRSPFCSHCFSFHYGQSNGKPPWILHGTLSRCVQVSSKSCNIYSLLIPSLSLIISIHPSFLPSTHSSIHPSIYGSTVPLLDLGRFFSFLILGRRISPSQGRYTQNNTQNKLTETSMPWVGFDPIIPVFERAKTVHALDRAATVIGSLILLGW
jgi:hypothetical protein